VERYLVVHGQILLNQIKAYPNAAVQKAPFVGTLRDKMEARKHSKLFYSKRGFSKAVKVVNRNPMKVRERRIVSTCRQIFSREDSHVWVQSPCKLCFWCWPSRF
jgi:hypothetical protein